MFLMVIKLGNPLKRLEASYLFIIYSIFGSLLMLIAIIFIYLLIGTTNNELLIIKNTLNPNNNINYFILILLFIGLAIKYPYILPYMVTFDA